MKNKNGTYTINVQVKSREKFKELGLKFEAAIKNTDGIICKFYWFQEETRDETIKKIGENEICSIQQ